MHEYTNTEFYYENMELKKLVTKTYRYKWKKYRLATTSEIIYEKDKVSFYTDGKLVACFSNSDYEIYDKERFKLEEYNGN